MSLQSIFFDNNCVVCGLTNCQESVDHQYITPQQIQSLFNTNRTYNHNLEKLCLKVKSYYKTLRKNINKLLQKDQTTMLASIRQTQFSELKSFPYVNQKLVGELASQDYSNLPSKRVAPIIEALEILAQNKNSKKNIEENQEFISIQERVDLYLSNHNVRFYKTFLKQNSFEIFLTDDGTSTQTSISQDRTGHCRKISIRQNQNPEQTIFPPQMLRVQIKGRIINQNSKQAELNNIFISDNDFVRAINDLKQMKLLQKLEIRNNPITVLTCKLIAFNLPNLIKLDIRGNKIKDEGLILICRNLKKMKQIYACQNEITDESVPHIIELKQLTMVWLQTNTISYEGAKTLLTLENLRGLALQGNLLTSEQGNYLRSRFLGYMSI